VSFCTILQYMTQPSSVQFWVGLSDSPIVDCLAATYLIYRYNDPIDEPIRIFMAYPPPTHHVTWRWTKAIIIHPWQRATAVAGLNCLGMHHGCRYYQLLSTADWLKTVLSAVTACMWPHLTCQPHSWRDVQLTTVCSKHMFGVVNWRIQRSQIKQAYYH